MSDYLVESSLNGQRWQLKPRDERLAMTLAQRYDLPIWLSGVLAARGVGLEDAPAFLAPRLKDSLPDPFHLLGMDKATVRVAQAIIAREPIAIFGDYDVDGATSSALLHDVLSAYGAPPILYIPDRMKEGYGPNAEALEGLAARGVKLVITVDCGTTAFDALKAGKAAGLDVIVIDHHQAESELPECTALINPNRQDETSEMRHLAAVGVAFLFAIALMKTMRETHQTMPAAGFDLLQCLDVVALGTVCDVMPLTGLNRALVAQGLKVMQQRKRLGLRVLADVAGMDSAPSAYHCGFLLGPRINAGGRVGQSDLGVRLLTTADEFEAQNIAKQLDDYNAERKAIEAGVLDAAMAQAEECANAGNRVLLLHSTGWHAGVIGIVAGRVKDKMGLPTAIVAMENGVGKASARSISGVDIGAAVTNAKAAGLLLAGGGHSAAAGFSVAEEKLPELQAFWENSLKTAIDHSHAHRSLWLDGHLPLSAANLALIEQMQQLAPFGMGNPSPRWCLGPVRVMQAKLAGQEHIRVMLADASPTARADHSRLWAVAFRSVGTPLGDALLESKGRPLQLAVQLSASVWQGQTRVDCTIEDGAWI